MDKSKTIREILENLCHNTMGNPPYRIDQALHSLKLAFLKDVSVERIIDILAENRTISEKKSLRELAQAIHDKIMGGAE